ncbi:MAG: RNase adapter RapZ [bacterium]|nr:RNase adapter RapZ [bacterium]
MPNPHLVIVTGMSGAGRSTAANVLEDNDFFVVDNLPPSLITSVADEAGLLEGRREKLAVVVDARGGVTLGDLETALKGLLGRGIRTTILFLDADDRALAKRFEETRRSHPVREGDLAEKIASERQSVEEIRGAADIIIDTTELNVHQLRERVEAAFAELGPRQMQVDVVSFGFKRGLPRVVDLLFDVRFLPNPHWVPELQPHTGLDEPVRDYVLGQPDAAEFMDQTHRMLEFLLPLYQGEGKAYLTIGIGCTGGKHRSVAIAEAIAQHLVDLDIDVSIRHRDIPGASQ